MDQPTVTAILERLCALLRTDARQRGQRHGLQPVQIEALLYLSRCNHYSDTPQAVADYLASTKGTVSQTLKVLERHGLIYKARDLHDGRMVHLQLTAEGKELAHKLAVPALFEQALRADGPRRDRLANDLRALLGAVQRGGDFRTFGVCHSCRHFLREDDGFRCGLTTEPLTRTESELICREHDPAAMDL